MKPYLEKFSDTRQSFRVLDIKTSSFKNPYHFHPEYELTLILKGTGKRFVGDNISSFNEGDLVLLGKNLPHCWLDYGKNKGDVAAIVIHFKEGCLGQDFFNLPELDAIKHLLDRSSRGIHFPASITKHIQDIISLMPYKDGLDCILYFLKIMQYLSGSDHRILSQTNYGLKTENTKFNRINVAFEYLYKHFKQEINISTVAGLVNMNISAFCHYFKKCTGKTFSEILNEIRIGYACKLLIETDLNVSEICYSCGYNSLSNFNKRFKAINQLSPLNYRNEFNKRMAVS